MAIRSRDSVQGPGAVVARAVEWSGDAVLHAVLLVAVFVAVAGGAAALHAGL